VVQGQHNFLFGTDLARSDYVILVADNLHVSNPAMKSRLAVPIASCAHGGLLISVSIKVQRGEYTLQTRAPGSNENHVELCEESKKQSAPAVRDSGDS
jgi:hypothetical protein